MRSIEASKDAILEDCEEGEARARAGAARALRQRFGALARDARARNELLRRALERTEAVFSGESLRRTSHFVFTVACVQTVSTSYYVLFC